MTPPEIGQVIGPEGGCVAPLISLSSPSTGVEPRCWSSLRVPRQC
jgi:hypothetical protein